MIGAVVSVTVTVCVQVAVLPAESVTIQVTVVTPTGKHDGASLVIEDIPEQASLAVGTDAPTCITAIALLAALLKL